MHIKTLRLCNFRNYEEEEFSFSPHINAIQGDNGQGKTNLLEAIYLIGTGRSFRTPHLKDLIRFGAPCFYIEALFSKQGIDHTLSLSYDGSEKKVVLDGSSFSHFHPLLGNLPTVVSSPEDLSLLVGSPQERRKFLDLYIAQTDPLYLYHVSRYTQAMKQRNCLLKLRSHDTMDAWESAMGEAASYLILKRQQATQLLSPYLTQWVDLLSDHNDILTVQYQTKPKDLLEATDIQKALEKMLSETREQEWEYGHTLIGPHRDDLLFSLSQKSIKSFSSQGQKRSCLSAIRFAEWEYMKEILGEKPLLGLDDFGMQLDATRRSLLQEYLKDFGQIFLTAPLFSPSADLHTLSISKGKNLS